MGALEPRLTVGPPGRLRGPRRNLKKFLRGIDQPTTERYLTYLAYYRPPELRALLAADLRSELARPRPVPPPPQPPRAGARRTLAQPAALSRREDVPAVPEPDVHRQDEHGRVHRGPRAAARRRARRTLRPHPARPEAPRDEAQVRVQASRRRACCRETSSGVPRPASRAPLRSWLVGPLRPMVDDLLSPEAVRARGLFDPAEVRRLVVANQNGRARTMPSVSGPS